jgi:tetraacyldisaccharide-1-P 4'-kinase
LSGFEAMRSASWIDPRELDGRRILAVAGVADPASFVSQLEGLGAVVDRSIWADHHAYTRRDLIRIQRAAGKADVIVMTLKDAVKLRALWPADLPEPWVAQLGVRWERGEAELRSALTDLTIHSRREPAIQ